MKAVRHAGIVVSNLEEALHFYQNLLGLKIAKRMNESGDFIDKISALKNVKVTTVKMAAEDGNLIELVYYHSPHEKTIARKSMSEIGISHVAFTIKNIDKEYKRLSEEGVQFNSSPQTSPDGYAKVAFCRGPDGVPIELVEIL